MLYKNCEWGRLEHVVNIYWLHSLVFAVSPINLLLFSPSRVREERLLAWPRLWSQSPHGGQRPAPRSDLDQPASSPGWDWPITRPDLASNQPIQGVIFTIWDRRGGRWCTVLCWGQVCRPGASSVHQHYLSYLTWGGNFKTRDLLNSNYKRQWLE